MHDLVSLDYYYNLNVVDTIIMITELDTVWTITEITSYLVNI